MSQPRLLCVDDEPALLEATRHALRARFQVETADGGEAGLACIAASPPFDAIVSDLCMPGMDGVAFLEAAREAAPGAVRLLLTGAGSVERAAAAINRGAISRFLLKPCPADQLAAAIEEALGEARAAAEEKAGLVRRADEVFGRLVEAERRATLGTLAGAIGDELANVTVAFDAALDLVRRAASGGRAPQGEELDILRRVGEHLASHGRHLRQLEGGGLEVRGAADLVECVPGAVDLLRFSGVLGHLPVKVEVPVHPVHVPLQRPQVEQLLISLLRNAVAAVEALPGRAGRLVVRVTRESGSPLALLAVEDNGAGIPRARLDRIFDPPEPAAPRRRRVGLGLFVGRHLVESRGGTLTVDSQEGRGTTVSIRLPVVAAPAGAKVPARAAS